MVNRCLYGGRSWVAQTHHTSISVKRDTCRSPPVPIRSVESNRESLAHTHLYLVGGHYRRNLANDEFPTSLPPLVRFGKNGIVSGPYCYVKQHDVQLESVANRIACCEAFFLVGIQ